MKTFWFVLSALFIALAAAQTVTRNVVLVTIDGLRWQEVFAGADATLLNADKEGGGVPGNTLPAVRAKFWAGSDEEREAFATSSISSGDLANSLP